MKKTSIGIFLVIATLLSCKSSKYADLGDGIFADIQTSKGDIILTLEYERTPVTVANFISLAEGTNPFVGEQYKEKKFYDGLIFHRVMKDFMIQGGDPLGSGFGNPGYKFKDEFNDSLRHDKPGMLSMANGGPGTNGSQFFITHKEAPFLNDRHSVFGEVVAGMEVVDSIANVSTSQENDKKDRPLQDVVIKTIEIVRVGKTAKQFDATRIMTDYFAEEKAKLAAIEKNKADFAQEITRQPSEADSLPSGLKIITLSEGQGDQPKIGQKVLVNYAGWLTDGTLFDTSVKEVAEKFGMFAEINKMHGGEFSPAPMDYSPESRLIAGFREGLMTMKVGDKKRLFIPPHLGYGPQGGGPIPPDASLIFDLEIVGITE